MIACPICGAKNELEAESCRQCGFGLSLARYTIFDTVPEVAGPPAEKPAVPEETRDQSLPLASPVTAPEGDAVELSPAKVPTPEALPTAVVVSQPEGGEAGLPADAAALEAAGETVPERAMTRELDELLDRLRQEGPYYARLGALRRLGRVEASTLEVVKELLRAAESGEDQQTRELAAEVLASGPHQQILEQHPELLKAAAEFRRRAQATDQFRRAEASRAAAEERKSQWRWVSEVIDIIVSILELFFR